MIARLRQFLAWMPAFVRSIRFRLSLWFTLVLAVILLAFSAFIYYRQTINIRQQALSHINLRLRDLDASFRNSFSEDASGGWLQVPGTSPGSLVKLYSYEAVILADPYGTPARYWGPLSNSDVSELAAQAPDREGGKLFSAWMVTQNSTQQADSSGYPAVSQPIEYLFITAPVGYEDRLIGWVVVGQPIDPEGQLPRLLTTLGIAVGLTLLGALMGGYWLADRALRPVKAITRTARQITDSDLSRRLNIRTRDELGELAGTFDSMLDRLQAAFNRQRRFTADASHELRTPLTIIGLETGRALEAGRSLAETRQSLQVIQSENEFMTRLVTELLTLARMEAGQVSFQRQPVDLGDLALEVVERYASIAQHKGITLRTGDLPEVIVPGDRQYLALVLGNLVDNAIKYSPDGDGQWVQIEVGKGESQGWVRISDNGPGIAPEHLPHLFERFYRADAARSHNPESEEDSAARQDIPGSGLGLAIVDWIVTLHGGTITVESQLGQGTMFEVRIPEK